MKNTTISKKRYLPLVQETQWAMTQGALDALINKMDANADAFIVRGEASAGKSVEYGEEVKLNVHGELFADTNLLTLLGLATSIKELERKFDAAVASPTVKKITLAISSPGGEYHSAMRLAEKIYVARGNKEIVAKCDRSAASAAYLLASSASKIIASNETDLFGSLGVIMTLLKPDENAITFVSSNAPYKNPDPTTDNGKNVYKGIVNKLESVFLEKIARNRGESVEFIKKNYGRGNVLLSTEALKVGMIDELINFNGGKMDITAKMVKDDHKAVYDEIVAGAVAPLQETITALEAKVQELTPAPGLPVEALEKINAMEKQLLESKLSGCLEDVKTSLLALHGSVDIDKIVGIGNLFAKMQERINSIGAPIGSGDTDEGTFQAKIDAKTKELVESGMSRTKAITTAYTLLAKEG